MATPELAALGAFAGNVPPPRLNETQRTAVRDILQRFDPQQLSRDDARAINAALEESGLRPSPGLRDELEANGFDARNLRRLAQETRGPQERPADAGQTPASAPRQEGLNSERFGQLRTAISTFQTSGQSDDDRAQLAQTLNQAGLFNRGSVLDLTL